MAAEPRFWDCKCCCERDEIPEGLACAACGHMHDPDTDGELYVPSACPTCKRSFTTAATRLIRHVAGLDHECGLPLPATNREIVDRLRECEISDGIAGDEIRAAISAIGDLVAVARLYAEAWYAESMRIGYPVTKKTRHGEELPVCFGDDECQNDDCPRHGTGEGSATDGR